MKKWICLLLSAALLFSLAGCAAPEDDGRIPVETRVPNRVPVTTTTTAGKPTVNTPDPVTKPSSSAITTNSTAATTIPTVPTQPDKQYTVIKAYAPKLTQTSGRLSYDTPSLGLDTNGRGYVGLTVKNTSHATKLTVYFTTEQDPNYTLNKSCEVTIDFDSNKSKRYVIDLSDLYGWTGKLKTVRVLSGSIFDGSMTLEKVEIYEGGELIPPFTMTDKVVVATREHMKNSSPSGRSYFPDGVMGVLANGDGTYNFISSGPLTGKQSVTIYRGSLDNPVKQFVSEGGVVQGTPFGYGKNEFNYASVGQVYRFSGSECFSIIHLEHHFDAEGDFDSNGVRSDENNAGFAASLALGYSPDNGNTWYYCGEIATHECESRGEYYGFGSAAPSWMVYPSRDITNGPFIVKDGYVYVYFTDYDVNYNMRISVMRAKLTDVIAAARAQNPAQNGSLFKKYYNGSFSQPSIAGKSSPVIDEEFPPNFMSVIYSTYLKKYIMARCSSPAYGTNDGDMMLNISADPTDFHGNNYCIDTDLHGVQYPTLVGIGGGDPSFETGKEVYLYYIDSVRDDRFLWDKADIVRRKITFK